MSENKKYYWLKLKDNFFDTEENKIIESQPNSEKYQILYLKLCLLSLKNSGGLYFKDHIPYDFKMLSTILRIDIDTVRAGLELFKTLELIEILDSGLMFMSDIESLIGKGSSEADRKIRFRERIKNQKLLEGGGQTSAKRPPEIEIELEIDKKILSGGLETVLRETKSIVHPSLREIEEYVREKNYNIDCKKFFEYYSSNDWKDKNNKPVKNWKLKLLVWRRDDTPTNKEFKDYK